MSNSDGSRKALRRLPPLRIIHGATGAAIAGILLYLLFAPKPWDLTWSGDSKDVVQYCAHYYSWWGGVIALVIVGLLGSTARWWLRPLPPAAPEGGLANDTPAAAKWFWPAVAAAMLLTAVLGAQRLPLSLWDDEHTTLRTYVQGRYKLNEDGTVDFRERGLGWALHDYRVPNNHILYSLLARVSVAGWKVIRDPAGPPFSESALRFPALLFGVASVGALALLLKELGWARAGIWAAFLLAVHPWHIRYASEGRGYSMILFFIPVLAICLIRALRTGAWRWWFALAGASFAVLYAYPGALYPVAATNAAAAVLLLARRPVDRPPWLPLARWWVAGSCAAAIFLWLFLPCVPQLQAYLDRITNHAVLGREWWANFGSHLFAGVGWFRSQDLQSPQPELYKMAVARPWLFVITTGTAAAMTIVGLARWWTRGWLTAAVSLVLVLPAFAAYFMAVRNGVGLHYWYLLYLLPGLVALAATGFDALAWPFGRWRWSAVIPALAVAAYLAAYVTLVLDAPRWLVTRSLQPLREAALVARGTTLPNYAGHEKVVTLHVVNPINLYDPHRADKEVWDAAELTGWARKCDAANCAMYVQLGMPWVAERDFPEVHRMLFDPKCFEVVADLPGFEPNMQRLVLRYRPGSASSGGPGLVQ